LEESIEFDGTAGSRVVPDLPFHVGEIANFCCGIAEAIPDFVGEIDLVKRGATALQYVAGIREKAQGQFRVLPGFKLQPCSRKSGIEP
jgi:hypothetical protein